MSSSKGLHSFSVARVVMLFAALAGCGGGGSAGKDSSSGNVPDQSDTSAPDISIASPSTTGSFSTSAATVTIAGIASDNVGVFQIAWLNDRGGGGNPTGTASWSADAIPLQPGVNVITFIARDAAANTKSTAITVTRDGGGTSTAPAGLAAVAGNARVSLSWSVLTGATSYNIKRSTVAGGPFASVQSGLTDVTFTDTSVTNGTTYYYVVSAVSAGGEGADSPSVVATPSAAAGGGLALPRIAWEGGPDCYKKFPQAQRRAHVNGSMVEAMFENRTLTIDANRRFSDSFANDFTVHIYKITP